MLSHFTCVRLSTTLWTVAHQAPLSKASAGKNTGVGSHGLLQGIFLTQGLNPHLLDLPALAGGFFTTTATLESWKGSKDTNNANKFVCDEGHFGC